MRKLLALFLLVGSLLFSGCKQEDKKQDEQGDKYRGVKFNEHIRSTSARTPEEERTGFKLPDGFEIKLYASEPDIGKPINIAFDAKGRMWVTQSFEYPFAATPGKGKDRLTILEDTDNDGVADKFLHFNDTLNIPIGILPLHDGAIVYSIPSVYRLTDTNGDGKADKQKKLTGPFEHRDTHGMVNNFISGYDGWVHACHGFTNRSNVAGADGDSVHMISGNTFRFRKDGSRVEHTTDGRINPFGLAYDERGYLYSTDCHTSPLYQLIRGADYTQWGKEEEMGFAPDMKPMENEATALCGIAYYADKWYPEAYCSNFYIGDPVSSRVYRNSFEFKGSTPVGKKEEDFVLSEDPWFRPVDVKLGPDGALYIADFYNSIIGHYEVPLDHPKRDRISGRIWRITYKGESGKTNDWTTASVEKLIEALNSENLPVRMAVADQLAERIGQPAVTPLKDVLANDGITSREYIHALWILQRLNALTDDIVNKSAAHSDPLIRLHTMRILGEQKDGNNLTFVIASMGLGDKDPHVKRAAVELMSKFGNMGTVETLIGIRKKTFEFDSHMIYTLRLTLRNLLRNPSLMKQIASSRWKNEDAAVLSTVMAGVQVPESGTFLYNYAKEQKLPNEELPKAFKHIARFIPKANINEVVVTAREKGTGDLDLEYSIFRALREGMERRDATENPPLKEWGQKLAVDILQKNSKPTDEASKKVIDEQKFAVDLAGTYKVRALDSTLTDLLNDTSVNNEVRASALRALMKIDPAKNYSLTKRQLESPASTDSYKTQVLGVMGEFPGPAMNKILAEIKNAPPQQQEIIVIALANSPSGKDIVFDKVRKGEIFPRTLIQPRVEERILLNITSKQQAQFRELTNNLETIDKERQSLITGRISDYKSSNPVPSKETGRIVFVRNCAPCHSISGEGGSIGPQLDGVGKWGVNSLSEKILDPNRNVSESFRNYTVVLKDGKVLSGLYRRDEGTVTIFADVAGKEFSVAKKDIAERKVSKYTLMPDQFGTTITPQDFNALLAYLLTLKN